MARRYDWMQQRLARRPILRALALGSAGLAAAAVAACGSDTDKGSTRQTGTAAHSGPKPGGTLQV